MAAFDPKATALERTWKPGGGPLIAVRFDPSGRYLFATSEDAGIRRLDLITGESQPFKGHLSWVRSLTFRTNDISRAAENVRASRLKNNAPAAVGGAATRLPAPPGAAHTVLSCDYHGQLLWWHSDGTSPKLLRTVNAHDGWARAVAVSPDGQTVATCGNDRLVKLWSAEDGRHLRTLGGHDCHVYQVAFHPREPRLISIDLKGIVKDWEFATGKHVRDLDGKVLHKYDPGFMADIGGARGIGLDATGSRLVCCGITNVSNAFAGVGNPIVVQFSWKDGAAKQFKPKDAVQGTAWGVGIHPSGWVISAGGGTGGQVWFWDGEDPLSKHMVKLPANARDFTLCPSGSRFAVAGHDGNALIYSLA